MTPSLYIAKADRALASARLLLLDGDSEGTCNRAYYAMFDAAQAALLGADGAFSGIRTHRGLIAAFGKTLVLTGRVDAELGRCLNRVENLRLIADYLDEPPSAEDAAWAIEQAETFIAVMRRNGLIP